MELPPHPNRDGIHRYHAWRWSREKIARESHNLIVLPTSRGGYEIYTRIRDFHKTALKDIITNISNGDREIKSLFGGKGVFEYPKSVDLIKLLVQASGDKDGLVVDFFSGSATTAHAVMKANAEDGGKRRYILIQKPERVKPGSVAEKKVTRRSMKWDGKELSGRQKRSAEKKTGRLRFRDFGIMFSRQHRE